MNAQNLHLRKVLQLNDVTICLDKLERTKAGGSARVNFYQEPLIYRFSVQSRLDFEHINNPSSGVVANISQLLKLVKFNFYCRKLDVSVTDQQLPMVIRLLELILAISDGTLSLPARADADAPSPHEDNLLSHLQQQVVTEEQTASKESYICKIPNEYSGKEKNRRRYFENYYSG